MIRIGARRVGSVVFAGLLGLLLSSCGQNQSNAEQDEARTFVAAVRSDPEYLDRLGREFDAFFEEQLGQCMWSEGFEYDVVFRDTSSDPSPVFVDEEYYKVYGLGVSTRFFNTAILSEGLVGIEAGGVGDVTDEMSDPAPVQSDPERQSYLAAFDTCEIKAESQARAEFPETELVFRLEELDLSQLNTDELDRVGLDCLRDEGYRYPSIDLLYEELEAEVTAIGSSHLSFDGPSAVIDDEGRDLLAGLQSREIEMARILWDCGWLSGSESAEMDELRDRYDRGLADLLATS